MPDRTALTPNSTIVRSPDSLTGDIDLEMVVLSVERGEYYQLNEVASRIWALAESPITMAALVDRLVEEFEVTRDACEAQVFDFVQRLRSERLVLVTSG
jgi:hypothetical protein